MQGTQAGAINKRRGLVTFASPSNAFTSLYALESLSPGFLIGADATNLYSVSTAGAVTSIKSGLSNHPWSFLSAPVDSAQGPLYGMNGIDTPQQWTGSGSTASWTATDAGGTVPNGKYCCYYQNQVYVSGVAASPSRLYWSGIAHPTQWNPANLNGSGFMDFDPNDGQAITGIGVVGPYVLVGKPRKLWVLVSAAAGTNRKLSDNIGIASHRSIVSAPEGTYFLTEDRGVYLTNGSAISLLSNDISPTIDAVGANKQNAAGATFGNHYYLSIAGSGFGVNDTTLDYDVVLKSWWKHSIGSNQFAVWHPAVSPQLYSAKSTAPIVDQCLVDGVYTDNGQPMTWVWRGPWQSPSFYRRRLFPTPYYRKRLRQVRLDGFGTVDFSLARDFAGMETLWRANVLAANGGGVFGAADGSIYGGADGSVFGASDQPVVQARFFSLGVANSYSLVFGSTSSTPDAVYSYLMILHDRVDLVVS